MQEQNKVKDTSRRADNNVMVSMRIPRTLRKIIKERALRRGITSTDWMISAFYELIQMEDGFNN